MQTRFDHIEDEEIDAMVRNVKQEAPYPIGGSDTERIASLAWWINYWKAWVGPPVTYYDQSGLHYDGQRRTRACKYLARRCDLQIQIPVRYAPEMK